MRKFLRDFSDNHVARFSWNKDDTHPPYSMSVAASLKTLPSPDWPQGSD